MNLLQEALRYLNDPFNWTRTGGILDLLGEHLRISALAVLAAMVLAIPAGMLLGHTGRGGGFTVALSNVSRAVPTLGAAHHLRGDPDRFRPDGHHHRLAVFAVPPILTNTYVGFRGVDRDVVEASRAMGFSEWQVATKGGTAARLAAAHDRRAHGRRAGRGHGDARRAGRRGRDSAASSLSVSASRTTARSSPERSWSPRSQS